MAPKQVLLAVVAAVLMQRSTALQNEAIKPGRTQHVQGWAAEGEVLSTCILLCAFLHYTSLTAESLSADSTCPADSSVSTVDHEKARSLIQLRSKRVQLDDNETEAGMALVSSGAAAAMSEDEKANFLITATFGPTTASMAAMGSMTKYEWIMDQMSLNPTLHRAHYRSRVNPSAGISNLTMLPRRICDKGSRWRNFAFSRGDEGRTVKVENGIISVDGKIRTNLMEPGFAKNGMNASTGAPWVGFSIDGFICAVEEGVGGSVRIADKPCNTYCFVPQMCNRFPNPALWLSDPSLSTEPALGFETGLKDGLLFLSQASLGCSLGSFIKQNGKYYMHDSRLELLNNEVFSPSGGKYEKAFFMISNNVTSQCAETGTALHTMRCKQAAEQLGLSFVEEVHWNNIPLKCITDGSKVWQNNRWWGPQISNTKYHLICEKPCPVAEVNFLNKGACRVESACGGTRDMVCGSPGEVANDPKQGHYYSYWQVDLPIKVNDGRREFGPDKVGANKGVVWANVAMKAQDQLRQRMAWALAQIFVISVRGFGREDRQTEQWVHFYDIFVRHAFGDLRDIVKEVTYSPMMIRYLSYQGSKSFDATGRFYPDENYAREVMQLFTIGQWMLNMDGTEKKGADGNSILVYDNDDIMNFARVFTGFDRRAPRGNVEHVSGGSNMIDPAFIAAAQHDAYPKLDLEDNFLGDRYPLCTDLPDQAFLRKGAVYEFIGQSYDGTDVVNVTEGSDLYSALKVPAVSIELASTVPCAGSLCTAETVQVVKVGNAFYEYVPPTCVNLFFYNPVIMKTSTWRWNNGGGCSHVYFAKAATACCGADGKYVTDGYDVKEQVTLPVAKARCAKLGLQLCVNDGPISTHERFSVWTAQECPASISVDSVGKVASQVGPREKKNPVGGVWRDGKFPTPEACPAECQGIRIPATSGNVTAPCGVVLDKVECPQPLGSGSVAWQLKCDADAKVQFHAEALCPDDWVVEVAGKGYEWNIGRGCHSLTWVNPTSVIDVLAGTHAVKLIPKNGKLTIRALQLLQGFEACHLLKLQDVKEDTCVCPMKVEDKRVFDSIPSATDLLDRLWIGAFPPDAFGQMPPGSSQTSGDVTAYMPSGSVDMSTTFAYQGRYYKNMESFVNVGNSYAIRNAPTFMNFLEPKQREALHEVDSFLDHLLAHPNVAPFLAYRLIQRFTTSNPTGSYMKAVSEAFLSGFYDGKKYSGNLGATMAAILLYPGSREEAPASLLDDERRDSGESTEATHEPDLRQLEATTEASSTCGSSIFNVPVASRTYSSVFSGNTQSMLHSLSPWIAQGQVAGKEWLQMDLEVNDKVVGVAVQGHHDLNTLSPQWVSTLTLSTSPDGAAWTDVPGEFAANTDAETVVKVLLPAPLLAKSVRIFPGTWQGLRPAMRAGLVMCTEQACVDGDVRLKAVNGSRGTPEIYFKGAFRPICSKHNLWGDEDTTQFCHAIGAEGGTWSNTGWIYDSDAVEVPRWGKIQGDGLTAHCQAGWAVGMEIECMCGFDGCANEGRGLSSCLVPQALPQAPAPTPASDSVLLFKVQTGGCWFPGCGAAKFYLNGEDLQGPNEIGFNVVTLSSMGKILEMGVFKLLSLDPLSAMLDFLQHVEHGSILLLGVRGLGHLYPQDANNPVRLLVEKALTSFGATQFGGLTTTPYALVAKKGFPGLTQEVVGFQEDPSVRTLEAAFEKEPTPSPPKQPVGDKLCGDWDVRIDGTIGTAGTPYVFLSGRFQPMCNRFNDASVVEFCKLLGASSGTRLSNLLAYETDAVYADNWGGFVSEHTMWGCAAGRRAGMWIECSADMTLHSSCTAGEEQECWYEAVPASECPCGAGFSSAACDALAECSKFDSAGTLCEADQVLPDGTKHWEIDNCPDGYDVFRLVCGALGTKPQAPTEGGVTLEVRSAGLYHGNSGLSEFYMQGVRLDMPAKDGINVVVLDSTTWALRTSSFNLPFRGPGWIFVEQAHELSAFLANVSDGSIVMLSVKGNADRGGWERHLVTNPLRGLGASLLGLNPNQPYALIAKKGFPVDGVHEKIGSEINAYRVVKLTAFFPSETEVTPAPTPSLPSAKTVTYDQAMSVGDPRFGRLREPVLKILHFMRAMEYEELDPRGDIPMVETIDFLGQEPYRSETVFNFYKPEYSPKSFAEGDVAPEFEIFDTNMAMNFINWMRILIEKGVCFYIDGNCKRTGYLKWSTKGPAEASISQLSTLLTGGRASESFLQTVYDEATEGSKMQAVQQAILFTPEFNTQGDSLPAGQQPEEEAKAGSSTGAALKPYKAIVRVYFGGGMDSFNMLVPMDCYLLDEYTATRQNVALHPGHLHKIDAESSNQACKTFGLHGALPELKKLYDEGSLAFVSNIGSLVEPLTRETIHSSRTCVGLYSHSNQELGAQTMTCQEKTARDRGAGGRLADALSKTYRTASWSGAGYAAWSKGFDTHIDMLGVVRLNNYDQLKHVVGNVTSVKYDSIYSEEYVEIVKRGAESGKKFGDMFDKTTMQAAWPDMRGFALQLQNVAKAIKLREERQAERDIFFVRMGDFDHHHELTEALHGRFEQINSAIAQFVAELKLLGVFDQVVLTTSSEFGRTLTSNGAGTDHGWAGNHFVIGGALAGGKILNEFPKHLAEGNEQDMGRGRMMPLYPWESMDMPVAQWMGLEDKDVNYVFPNAANFNASKHFIPLSEMFPVQ